MVKYDEEYLITLLKKHGWNPVIPIGHMLQKDWVLMGLQIALLEKLSND
jgi:hypothetical protein